MSEGAAEGIAWTGYGSDQIALEQWVRSRIGDKSMDDLNERSVRVAEEALELYQAEVSTAGGDLVKARAVAHRLVDVVFDKPVGLPEQEGSGVITCLLRGLPLVACASTFCPIARSSASTGSVLSTSPSAPPRRRS